VGRFVWSRLTRHKLHHRVLSQPRRVQKATKFRKGTLWAWLVAGIQVEGRLDNLQATLKPKNPDSKSNSVCSGYLNYHELLRIINLYFHCCGSADCDITQSNNQMRVYLPSTISTKSSSPARASPTNSTWTWTSISLLLLFRLLFRLYLRCSITLLNLLNFHLQTPL
jgi:hypothetical protein